MAALCCSAQLLLGCAVRRSRSAGAGSTPCCLSASPAHRAVRPQPRPRAPAAHTALLCAVARDGRL